MSELISGTFLYLSFGGCPTKHDDSQNKFQPLFEYPEAPGASMEDPTPPLDAPEVVGGLTAFQSIP